MIGAIRVLTPAVQIEHKALKKWNKVFMTKVADKPAKPAIKKAAQKKDKIETKVATKEKQLTAKKSANKEAR